MRKYFASFLLFQSVFKKGFLQDVRDNLLENWPGLGRCSGLSQLNPCKIYRKVSLWLLLLHFSQLLQYPFLHPRNLNLGHSHFFCNLCLCHILKIPKYDQSFLLSFQFFQNLLQKNPVQKLFMAILFFRKPVHKLQIRSISLIHSLVNRIHLCSRFQRHRQFFNRHIHSI